MICLAKKKKFDNSLLCVLGAIRWSQCECLFIKRDNYKLNRSKVEIIQLN